MLYRILTNAKYRNDVVGLVSKSFDKFAVLDGAQYTKGAKQYAMVIEIDATREQQRDVQLVAGAISALLGSAHRTDVYSLEHTKLEGLDPQAEEAKAKEQVPTPPVPNAPKTGRVTSGGSRTGKGEGSAGQENSNPSTEA